MRGSYSDKCINNGSLELTMSLSMNSFPRLGLIAYSD